MQLAQKASQLAAADQQHVHFEQQIEALRAELTQQHAEVYSLQSQLEAVNEREMAASVAADLDRVLDDPDQLPAEAHQLMSSLRREVPASDLELPAKLRQLQQQLQRKEEEMKERDSAMQQLLRGADRIEDVQKATLAQLADAQSEVPPFNSLSPFRVQSQSLILPGRWDSPDRCHCWWQSSSKPCNIVHRNLSPVSCLVASASVT